MWTRKELKERAKAGFTPNYWRCVLVALIFTLITGGISTAAGGNGGNHNGEGVSLEMDASDLMDAGRDGNAAGDVEAFVERQLEQNGITEVALAGILVGVFAVIAVVALIVAAIALLVQIFLWNPLSVGCNRFFVKNLGGTAQVKEICYGFDNHYKNHVKIMFLRGLYTFLWTLLFVIPGIVKSYEYQMVPYILAENPDITKEDAFALSKRMMDGNKWNSFVLDLSFLGWQILNGLTFGILGIFYVNPYICQTHAALYETLRNQQTR